MKRPPLYLLASVCIVLAQGLPNSGRAGEIIFNTQDFAPFNYEINGVVSGPAAEIISRVCLETKLDCKFNLLPWKRAQAEVRSGKAHGMFVIGWNKQRAEWLHFTPPIMQTEYGFFVQSKNAMDYQQLADVKGLTVAVYGPSNTATSLGKIREQMVSEGIEPISIDMRPDDEAGFKKLALGRIDAVFSNRDVGLALIAKMNLTKAIRYAGPSRSLKYYIGFSIEHTDKSVLEQFDSAYLSLYKQGVIKQILDRYQMQAAAIE